MMWIKTPTERHCPTCGVTMEKWVLRNNLGHRVAEATFCPVCYPDVEQVFQVPQASRNAA